MSKTPQPRRSHRFSCDRFRSWYSTASCSQCSRFFRTCSVVSLVIGPATLPRDRGGRAAEAVLNGFEQAIVEGVHYIADGDGPAAAAAARLAVERVGVHRLDPAAARARAGDRPLAAGLRRTRSRRAARASDRRLRRRASTRLMRVARPRALPRRGRRLGRERRRAARPRVPGRRAGAAPVHDAAAPAARPGRSPSARRARRSTQWSEEEGGYVAHPGHAAADARLRAAATRPSG